MLVILSPAKTLDWTTPLRTQTHTQPSFLDDSNQLIGVLQEYDAGKISSLMKVSEKIANLNVERYQSFETPFSLNNARQALLAFKGDSYLGFELDEYGEEDFAYAQKHLRILSGLYGLLRPLDLIQPYRLEMGTKLKNARGKDLYAFWGEQIQEALLQAIQEQGDNILVNLASNEYFRSAKPKTLDCQVIQPVFKEYKNGEYKMITIYAKRARGTMTNFILRNRVEGLRGLQDFQDDGYKFHETTDHQMIFHRRRS